MTTTRTKGSRKPATTATVKASSTSEDQVDPRLAARRRSVKRSEGRRRLRTLMALSIITISAIAALALLQSSWMDVDVVVIEGSAKTDHSLIETAAGIELGEALVELDLGEVEQSVLLLPWIATAEATREWNGTITLVVTERTPSIALRTPPNGEHPNGQYALVDRSGRQLDVVDDRPYGFMPIAGLIASGEPGQPAPSEAHGLIRLLDLMSPERQQEVAQIVIDERSIYLDLTRQGRVRLGNDSGLAEKLVSLDTILATVDLRCLWEIDVRVHTAPAVTRLRVDGLPRAPLTDLSTCT